MGAVSDFEQVEAGWWTHNKWGVAVCREADGKWWVYGIELDHQDYATLWRAQLAIGQAKGAIE